MSVPFRLAPQKLEKNGTDRTSIVENEGLKLRHFLQKKMSVGRGKSADTASFKFKNTKLYVNIRVRKKSTRKTGRGGTDALEDEGRNSWSAPY